MPKSPPTNWRSLILAGDRHERLNPVAEIAGVDVKVLAPVAGSSMLRHVYDILNSIKRINTIAIIGHAMLLRQHDDFVDLKNIEWIQQDQPSPVTSAYTYLKSVNDDSTALFVTTGDHALLKADWVDFFLEESIQKKADMVIGLTRFDRQAARRERGRRTLYRFKDGAYSGCNMFALMTPRLDRVLALWMEIEKARKSPLRVVSLLGWHMAVRYLFGRLGVGELLDFVSEKFDCRISFVTMPDPLTATDVDSVEDWHRVCELVEDAVPPLAPDKSGFTRGAGKIK